MNPAEWDACPWWYTALLIEGLTDEGVLKDPNSDDADNPLPGKAVDSSKAIDLSGGMAPNGFTTRRVG